ncbi:sigma-54-dependent transcriptional regulator [Antarcticimicrobium luteum]|uniref:Sigma-54-dependent Fis family transcriptional regulator n=1 Tax=Antarcticimicrobium luteum TaxID=2547397 RepID=A0A4R5VHJ4_9RHOB|nr:response regulator [Antarcticimicrobium luteum]TDK53337.1 sigma-54-dependent Fis family transcriptional regulator [Antarcticimicrobium luteum]
MTLKGRHIVLVEDDEIMGGSIHQRLELEGASVAWVKLKGRGVSAIRTPRQRVDGVVCDIRLPDGTGEELYEALCRTMTPPPFLFITGQGGIDQAVRLLQAGAADYITKPFDMGDFLDRLVLILRPEENVDLPPETGISSGARRVDALVAEYAAGDWPVLIRGSKGLGKARLARRIHDLSDRRAAPFVEVNAHRSPGDDAALTGAIAEVGEGTLHINGLESLSQTSQGHLIAALSTGAQFRAIASAWPATDQRDEAEDLRADLLYLFKTHEIFIPPLSDRPDDAVWLAKQFFETLNRRRDPPLRGLSSHSESAIRDHDWPGNGRELRARLLRAVEAAHGEWLFPSDLFPELGAQSDRFSTLAEARGAAERQQIIAALARTDGHILEAAKLLKVSRTTLWEKMQKLGL